MRGEEREGTGKAIRDGLKELMLLLRLLTADGENNHELVCDNLELPYMLF